MTFAEFVAFYGLARSEGLVLRYLSDAYRALRQTVPDSAKTEELDDLIEWLGELVRQTDSSLLDEWEALTDPDAVDGAPVRPGDPRPAAPDHRQRQGLPGARPQRDVPPGRAGRPAALDRPGRAGRRGGRPGPGRLAGRARGVLRRARPLGTGPDARGPQLLQIEEQAGQWRVRQIIDDPAGDHDWGITAAVDLAASDEAGEAVVRTTGFEPL